LNRVAAVSIWFLPNIATGETKWNRRALYDQFPVLLHDMTFTMVSFAVAVPEAVCALSVKTCDWPDGGN